MSQTLVEGFRLSPPQRHLWRRQGDHVGPYRVCATVCVRGPLDPDRLEAGLRALARRHEALRTTYRLVPGMKAPMQVVLADARMELEREELRSLAPDAQARALEAAFQSLAESPVDLARGPVWRARLLTRSAADATLLLMWPSLVADAASVAIVVRELAGLADGGEAMQHLEVAEWQHELLEADGTAAGREFWRQIDREALAASRLSWRRSQGRGAPFARRTLAAALPPAVAEGLSSWAEAHGVTPEDGLLAGWQVLMWRLSGRRDLVVGVGSDGRPLQDLEPVVGPLGRTLPVSCALDPGWSFAELVARSRAARVDHLRWQSLFAWDGADEGEAAPFCPLVVEAQRFLPVCTDEGTTWAVERVEACSDRADLKAAVALTTRGWEAWWTFDEAVHTPEQVACVADQYAQVLLEVLGADRRTLAEIDLRGEWERLHARPVPVAFPGAPEAERAPFVHHLLAERAKAHPDREAVAGEDGRLTYAELNARADRLAAFLQGEGVGPETRVGLLLEHSCDLLVAAFGILKAGGTFVPLPPEQPLARLAGLVERVGAKVVVTHRRLTASWPATSPARLLRLDENAQEIAAALPVARPVPLDPANLAYVMFTSGSTGEPKGVMVPHGALARYAAWSRAAYLPNDEVSVLLHSSIGFDATLTSLLVPASAGARVQAAPDTRSVEAIARLASVPERRGFLKLTPAHLGLVAARVADGELSSLTDTLVIGGEALAGEQLAAWQAQAPATRIINEYGPTEATVGCLVHDAPAGRLEPGPVPIGRPVAGVNCHALDPDGRAAAVGVTGELYVGGAQLARGYEGRPDLTAERFLPDPFAGQPGARCYRTGDLVRLRADGAFEYVGRRDHQVKLRGHRVELGEVEAAVRRQAGVHDVAVLLREDVPGERRLVAYVVPAGGTAPASDRLQQALRESLPDYMVPAVIVPLEALPTTANGKVDRERLPVPDGLRPKLTAAYAPPRTEAEATLARIWAEVLRMDRVGIHDNFFALGGDSILSLQIVARAARAGLRIAPRLVFEHPTVEALAAASSRSLAAPADQGPVTGPVPLTPIQHWFFELPFEDRHYYNQALALDLVQAVSPAVLEDAWLRLQFHHDALRLRYWQSPAGWQQVSTDVDAALAPVLIDASRVALAHRERVWNRVARDCQRSLDLEHGPIARMATVQWGPASPPRLLIVLHHVVCDGLSWRVLLEDLQELCRRDTTQELPPKTASLKAWAEKLVAFVNGGGFDMELPLWKGMSEAGARVPRDRPAGANTVASQRTVAVTFGAEETEALLHRLPASLGVHVQDALLTGLLAALARWTAERTWRIDLESHGRETLGDGEDVSRTLGWFTCVYPVRLTAPPADGAVAALHAVRAAVGAIPGHGLGYGALRYLREGESVAALRGAEGPEIILNYWGQLDQVFASSAAIRPARVPVGPSRSRRQTRSHVFEVNASVVDGRLQVGWTYSENLHEAATVQRLAEEMRRMVALLAVLPDEARASLKTPADFPLAALGQAELDLLLAEGGPAADIYPLSPMQEGLLFHWLYEADGGVYTQQFAGWLSGPLDTAAFLQAWEETVARHDILRTGFFWERGERPLQVVRERVTLPWALEDWRGVAPAEQEVRLADRLEADRRHGFAVERPPLMRVSVIRLAEERWHVLWTSHHLVLDGWSMPLVLRDVLVAYAAQREGRAAWTEPPGARYGDYIAWLARQDESRSEAFWRHALDGLKTPTLVAAASEAAVPHHERLRAEIPAALIEGLQRLGASHGITMNTWFAGAWGLLLAHLTRQPDVVFGAVVAGRPADLPGIEAIPGLFINTLPLRLKVAPGTPALAWFAECQRRQVEAREHEHVSLARIQGWSALGARTPLFDTMFAYENYPVEQAWRQQTELRLEQASASADTNFPIAIEVAGTRSDLVVNLTVDRARLGPALGKLVRDGFEVVLSRFVARPDQPLGALLERLDEFTLGTDANGDRHRGRQESLRALRQAASRPHVL